MDWMMDYLSQNPYLPGLIVVGLAVALFFYAFSRHQKRVESKLEEIVALLKAPTQIGVRKHD